MRLVRLADCQVLNVRAAEHDVLKHIGCRWDFREIVLGAAPLGPKASHVVETNGVVLGVDTEKSSLIADAVL